MDVTLSEIASLLSGELVGDASVVVNDALPLSEAQSSHLTMLDDAKHTARLDQTSAAAVVVPEVIEACEKPQIVVADVHQAFTIAIKHLRGAEELSRTSGVHHSATIDPSAAVGAETYIGPNVSIAANCSIGQRCVIHPGVQLMSGVSIGDDCELYPGVVLYENTRVSDRVLLHAGAVLGAYGFGYRQVEGTHQRTGQLGWVEVEADVEIGANTSIDRGTYGPTTIGQGTKIDNLVQIGHNCRIGKHNLICSQVGIAGSTTTEDYVVLAGQVGLADHIRINQGAIVAAQSGVMRDIAAGEVQMGSPAAPSKQKFLEYALVAKLPEMRKQLKEMQRELAALKADKPTDSEREAA